MPRIGKEALLWAENVRQAQCKHVLPKIVTAVPISAKLELAELVCPNCGFFEGIILRKAQSPPLFLNEAQNE